MRNSKVLAWAPLLFVLVSASVVGAIRDNHITSDIVWSHDFAAGLRDAGTTHRPMLLSFRSAECGWCGKMDAETFSDPRLLDLSRRFVCVAIDADMDSATLKRYGVMDLPVTIVADEQGKALLPFYGFVSADTLAPALQKALHVMSAN